MNRFEIVSSARTKLASLIWCAAILAAFLAAIASNFAAVNTHSPLVVAALIPGVIGLVLSPLVHREWAQVAIVMSWVALAMTAALTLAFVPMAILFLCVPAAAALFERERVIEAMVITALAAGLVYAIARYSQLAPISISEDLRGWSEITAICGTITFMIAALFAVSDHQKTAGDNAASLKQSAAATSQVKLSSTQMAHKVLSRFPGAAFYLNDENCIEGMSARAREHFSDPSSDIATRLGMAEDEQAAFNAELSAALDDDAPRKIILQLPANEMGKNRECAVQFDIRPEGDGCYIFLRDVTGAMNEVEALRSELHDQDGEVEDRNLFFAGVSHELRTPLNAIIGFSDMMRSRLFGPLPGKYSEYADLIHESGQHMLDLLGDVLDMSKIEAGKYELSYDHFELEDVIRSSVKMVRPQADSRHVALDIEIDDPAMPITADRRAVRQILLNLLSNAVKFTPKGGRVVVSSGAVGSLYEIAISDNGQGMSAEELKTVGQPYAQARAGQQSEARGSGLGLSLVKSLTELHGGEFAIDSAPDEGTRATVTLPRRRANDA